MKQLQHLATILFLLYQTGLCTPLHAQHMADSLRHMAEQLPHNAERLNLLFEVARLTQVAPEGIRDASALYHEADLQQNDSMRCTGAAYITNHYYVFGDNAIDSIRKWAEITLPCAKRVAHWIPYFEVQKTLISAYIYADRYEYALDEARKMEREALKIDNADGLLNAYLCQGMAYQGSNQWREAMQSYQKGYHLPAHRVSPILRMNLTMQMLTMLLENDHYADMKPYIDVARESIERIIEMRPQLKEAFNDFHFLLEGFSTYYCLSTNQSEKAEKHIRTMEHQLATLGNPTYRKLYVDAVTYYHLQRAEYNQALALNDTSRVICETLHLPVNDQLKVVEHRGDIFYAMGDYDQALRLYTTADTRRDSLNQAISDRQMREIREMYELDKLQYEKTRLENRNQLLINIFIGLLMIGLLYLFLRLRHIYRALRHSARETRTAVEITEEANEAKRRFLATMSHAIRVPLDSVVGFSQILALEEDLTDEERQEFGEIIHSNTDKLMFLVNSVLDLSRLEAGMTKWQMSDYDLIQLCHDAIGNARIQNPQLHITFDCATEQCPIHTDTSRMMQLFVSLLAGTVTLPKEEREIDFTLRLQGAMAEGTIKGSPLADVRNCNQETDLRHSINRLTLEYFGGSYRVEEEQQTIHFALRVNKLKNS